MTWLLQPLARYPASLKALGQTAEWLQHVDLARLLRVDADCVARCDVIDGALRVGRRIAKRVDVICHGDLHPFNLLVDEHGEMIVLDWTGATIAAPEMDVGFTAALLRCAPIAVPRMIAPVIARVTNRLAETFVGACRSTETLDDSALDWWEALQCARCLSEVAGARVGSAVTVAEAHPFETAAPMMLRRLRQLTGVEVTLPPRCGS